MDAAFDRLLLEEAKQRRKANMPDAFKYVNKRIDMLIYHEQGALPWQSAKLALQFENNRFLEETALVPIGDEPFLVLHKTIQRQTPNRLQEVVEIDCKKYEDDIYWFFDHMRYATKVDKDGVSLIVFYKPLERYLREIR